MWVSQSSRSWLRGGILVNLVNLEGPLANELFLVLVHFLDCFFIEALLLELDFGLQQVLFLLLLLRKFLLFVWFLQVCGIGLGVVVKHVWVRYVFVVKVRICCRWIMGIVLLSLSSCSRGDIVILLVGILTVFDVS